MNIRKKWIAMVLAFTMAVSPLPGAAVRAESTEPAGEEIVVLETAEEAEADAESLGEVEVQAGETAEEELDAAVEVRAARYSYTWFYVSTVNGTDVEIGTEGEAGKEELGKRLVEKYYEGKTIVCKSKDLNDENGEFLAEAYPSVSDKKDETFPANCAEEGKITFVVDFNFGEHKLGVTLPKAPNAHTELVHENEKDATCEEEGHVAGYTCQGCGKHFEDEEAKTEIAESSWVTKGIHSWNEILYAWADNKKSCIAFHTCSKCSKVEVIESVVTTETTDLATCKSEGKTTYVAKFTSDLCEKQVTCEVTLPINPKVHTKLEYEALVDATCEESGHAAGYTCQGCGKHFKDIDAKIEIAEDSWIISAKGHDWKEWEVTKSPTCKEKGERIRECRRDADHIEREELPVNPKKHKLDVTVAKDATCTEAGNSLYYTCQECGKYFLDADAKTEIKENSWVIPAKGHDWTEWEVVKQPTCNAKGEIVRTCKRDASHEERKELVENPKAHKLTVTPAKDATCTEAGNMEYYTCQECGKYFSDPGTENEIAENSWIIPAKGHDWTEWEVTKTPTCTKKGERIRTCKRDASHVEKEELPEDPKAHTLVSTAVKAPTCTENGNSAYYTCQECGKHFSDSGAEKEIAKESWIIKATGHKLTKTAAKAATCTAAGNSEYYTCKECGKYYADANGNKEIKKDSWVIKAKGHQIREKEIKPTASKEGSLVRSCEACGYVQEQYTLPRTALKMTMGKSKKIISKAEGCTFAVPKSAKKYLAVAKTGKITAAKKPELYKDVKKIVPVKVKVGGKDYTVKVKLEIPAPNIRIKKFPITIGGRSGFHYAFYYDLAGATKIRVRVKGMAFSNSELDQYVSKAKSDNQSYINYSSEAVKKQHNKVTFQIVAYYGKRISKTKIITIK